MLHLYGCCPAAAVTAAAAAAGRPVMLNFIAREFAQRRQPCMLHGHSTSATSNSGILGF